MRLSAKKFIVHKIITAIKWQGISILPGLILYTALHWSDCYIAIAFYILSSLALIANIILKYARYAPGDDASSSSILQSLILLSIIMPWFIPLPLFVIVFYSSKSLKNLNYYLHDFN